MRNDKLTQLIFDQQLISVMNRTKWRELAKALTSNKELTPDVKLGYLDGYESTSFCSLDWEWVKFGESRVIKWLEISPVRRDYIGRLVKEQETDFSDWVRSSLAEYTIPFTESGGTFRIDAYLQPNKI